MSLVRKTFFVFVFFLHLLLTRLLLVWFSVPRIQKILFILTAPFSFFGASLSPSQIGKLIASAGRRVPVKQVCLIQALAAEAVCKRLGKPCRLHIGVLKEEAHSLQAHAWLESEGKIVTGEKEASDYTPLKKEPS